MLLTGGVIDGQGQPWYEKCTRCHYPPPIGQWPHANASCLKAGRPMLLQFTFVDGLTVFGESVTSPLTIQNSCDPLIDGLRTCLLCVV